MIYLFASGGQSIGASASASVLPMNIEGYSQGNPKFPLGLTFWSPCSPRDSQEVFFFFFPALHFFSAQSSLCSILHVYMTTGKNTDLTTKTFVGKVMVLPFNILSKFVRASLPRGKCLLISRLQSLFTVISEPKIKKSVTTSTFSPCVAMNFWDWKP